MGRLLLVDDDPDLILAQLTEVFGSSQHRIDVARTGAEGICRVSERAPDFADVTALAQALVAANPDRIVWGSDWPHPNSDAGRGKPLTEISSPFPIDDGLLLNQLPKWVPDAAVRKKILVDNPARLYGFGAVAG